jgi:hypothetical protein
VASDICVVSALPRPCLWQAIGTALRVQGQSMADMRWGELGESRLVLHTARLFRGGISGKARGTSADSHSQPSQRSAELCGKRSLLILTSFTEEISESVDTRSRPRSLPSASRWASTMWCRRKSSPDSTCPSTPLYLSDCYGITCGINHSPPFPGVVAELYPNPPFPSASR